MRRHNTNRPPHPANYVPGMITGQTYGNYAQQSCDSVAQLRSYYVVMYTMLGKNMEAPTLWRDPGVRAAQRRPAAPECALGGVADGVSGGQSRTG
jgi:hypothetical protein